MQSTHGSIVVFALQNLHSRPYKPYQTTRDARMSVINLLTSALTIISGASLVGYIAYVGALA
jgi:hypothetical protein